MHLPLSYLEGRTNAYPIRERSVGEYRRLYGAVKFFNDWHAGGSTLESIVGYGSEALRPEATGRKEEDEKRKAGSVPVVLVNVALMLV